MPSEIEKATVLPAENAGILKNRSGISALGVFSSHRRNATIRTTNNTSEAMILMSLQPSALASINP